MASEKQIAANRQNAFKAGVKTAQGKLAVRLNAVSHGLFTQDVLLPGEDAKLLAKLRDNMHAELKPVGELETILVERIISSAWRLKRTLHSEQTYGRPAAAVIIMSWSISAASITVTKAGRSICVTRPLWNGRFIKP
jgi:hypothetical protein